MKPMAGGEVEEIRIPPYYERFQEVRSRHALDCKISRGRA
jgi:hypothetical protein